MRAHSGIDDKYQQLIDIGLVVLDGAPYVFTNPVCLLQRRLISRPAGAGLIVGLCKIHTGDQVRHQEESDEQDDLFSHPL
jgi:hypothetical protein